MTEFRTLVSIAKSIYPLGMQSAVLTLGSCFANAIGSRLHSNKINTLINPFGILYNPHSIHNALQLAIYNQSVEEASYLQNGEVFLNYNFHSDLSSLNQEDLRMKLTQKVNSTHNFLKTAQFIIITYGSAWVHERNDTGEIVANCHKMPADHFTKSLLSQKKIIDSFDAVHQVLKTYNPQARIILTVSPVRHIKETLELNNVSKSVLRLACHSLSSTYDNVDYFPAYEIMMDDLRDYRFYKTDMIHPSEEAEEYIWQRFIECYANADVKRFLQTWKPLLEALAHKPFHPSTAAHQKFLQHTLERLEALKDVVDVNNEINSIKKQLL
jgi:hypothetical protein